MTTGGSILSSIETLTRLGYNVKYVFTIFQREPVDYELFADMGITYNYLITKSDLEKRLREMRIVPVLRKLHTYVKEKRSNIIINQNKNI